MNKTICLFILVFNLILLVTTVSADDLIITGSLNGTYLSDSNIYSQGTCTTEFGSSAILEAPFSIILQPGFHAKTGSSVDAKIGDGLDSDSDLLPDWWENKFFGNVDQAADDDPDDDGLTNMQEYILGTDPTDGETDSDGDGLADGWELSYFTSLDIAEYHGDNDSDGIENFIEQKFETDPNDPESKPKPGCTYEYDALGRIKKVYRIK
jgi:hypothetical protein